ncbi:hypothetical protein DL762_009317 [Monosporascus cannonballus]|uniref:Uncharacterized protein n=1 Tax=Monosporascus cannonballus TaxID=155416 RepID=A0ABY0GU10_9PEZI|nr:hypothetical protein DL762_009317 [Monosporascus cannonballus]
MRQEIFWANVCSVNGPEYAACIDSLAKNPHREEKVATVTFNETPPQFRSVSVEEWYLKVPAPNQVSSPYLVLEAMHSAPSRSAVDITCGSETLCLEICLPLGFSSTAMIHISTRAIHSRQSPS